MPISHEDSQVVLGTFWLFYYSTARVLHFSYRVTYFGTNGGLTWPYYHPNVTNRVWRYSNCLNDAVLTFDLNFARTVNEGPKGVSKGSKGVVRVQAFAGRLTHFQPNAVRRSGRQ